MTKLPAILNEEFDAFAELSLSSLHTELANTLVFLSGTEVIMTPQSCSGQKVRYKHSDQKLILSADLTMPQGQRCLRYQVRNLMPSLSTRPAHGVGPHSSISFRDGGNFIQWLRVDQSVRWVKQSDQKLILLSVDLIILQRYMCVRAK